MKPTIVERGLNENILCMGSFVKLIVFDENTGVNSIGYCGGIEIAESLHQLNESTPILKDVTDHHENAEDDDIQKKGKWSQMSGNLLFLIFLLL